MFWKIVALIGATTFFVTGFGVLFDPNCVTAGFSGGRAVTLTCHQDSSGDMPGALAGLLSIAIGIGIISLAFWVQISNYWRRRKLVSTFNRGGFDDIQYSGDGGAESLNSLSSKTEEKIPEILPTGESNEFKKCSFCAELIRIEAIKCRYCGSLIKKKIDFNIQAQKLSRVIRKPEFYLVVVPIIVIIAFFTITSLNNAKKNAEIEILKESGQVCVSLDYGETFTYGCDDYPIVDFEWCATYEFALPYWDDEAFGKYRDLTNLNNGIMTGIRDPDCSEEFPFAYRVVDKTIGLSKGDYLIHILVYGDASGTKWLEDVNAGPFTIRIS